MAEWSNALVLKTSELHGSRGSICVPDVIDENVLEGITPEDAPVAVQPPPEAEGPAPLAEIGLFQLLDAFERVLQLITAVSRRTGTPVA